MLRAQCNLKPLLVILIVSFSQNALLGQIDDVQNNKKLNWHALPSAFYTPETNIGLGVIVLMSSAQMDSTIRKSNAQFYLDFTLRKQIQFQNDHNTFFRISNRTIFFNGSSDLSRFPELFFGIGNQTDVKGFCLIDFKLLNIKEYVYVEFQPSKYVGMVVHHQSMHGLSKDITTPQHTYTNKGYTNTGVGLSFLIDKRDNIFNPKKGHYIQGGVIQYADHFGLSKGFLSNWIDARYYKTVSKNIVINTNVCLFNNTGTVPFRMMPSLGGPRFLRGYYMGRFRDNNASVFRAEFRRNLVGRFGVAVFGDMGRVYHDLRHFNENNWNYTGGFGLRFKHDLVTDANIRIDYGRSKDSHGLYIVYAEAF